MSKRLRRIAQREVLMQELDKASKELYHNATLSWPYNEIPDGFEDTAWDAWNFYAEMELRDINAGRGDAHYIEGYIATKYGKVYTWGRGGRTCAPEGWISQHGASFSTKRADDIVDDETPRWKIAQIIRDIRAWNGYVEAACSKESILEVTRVEIEEEQERRKEAGRELARLLTA